MANVCSDRVGARELPSAWAVRSAAAASARRLEQAENATDHCRALFSKTGERAADCVGQRINRFLNAGRPGKSGAGSPYLVVATST